MTVSLALFVLIAVAVGTSAAAVVASNNVIRCAVFLLLTLVGVSLLFFLMGAEFLGAAQLIIYVGGTMVLVVFGGMLTSGGPVASFPKGNRDWTYWLLGGSLSVCLFLLLVGCSIKIGRKIDAENAQRSQTLPSTAQIGLSFLGVSDQKDKPTFLLPFELVSIHLLVVLIGAAYLARAKKNVVSQEKTTSATEQ
jgi:NADH-quinone oxidoreductase subunit J